MNIELGQDREKLIAGLYDLDAKLDISRDERTIPRMAIQTLEYLEGYAADISIHEYLDMSQDERRAAEQRATAAKRRSNIQITEEDYQRLICLRGFEFADGQLIPRH